MAGLGNPGPEYVWSRHNAGWLAIDSFTERKGLGEPRMKFSGAFWPPSQVEGESVAFLKPFTYMNLSGKSVTEAARYYDITPSDILIIFDDAAIPFGSLRYRSSGSAGGHKGMISVITLFDTLDIPRLRLGIGGPPPQIGMKDWALGKIPKEQRDAWPDVENLAWEALSKWLLGASGQGFTLKIAELRRA
ncbi:MAG: aminoacyl-tRNA hydrolase [Synergistaceae bacterium]|nr:aminoacyl-tRNA hydrolase [Synergistaceae bacterium]